MAVFEKGNSPFYPNHPVPAEFFVGRSAELEKIERLGIRQAAHGKLVPMYVQGEYGIGKTSIARVAQQVGEEAGMHPVYCSLGGARTLEDVAAAVLAYTIRSGAMHPDKEEKIWNWLGKYLGQQQLFGFSLNLAALRQDAPQLATPYGVLEFLSAVRERLGAKGIFLVLDEINGITANPDFAHFLKGLVDGASFPKPLPLLLMLCGVEERRREMIEKHPPVDRIFEVVAVEPMSLADSEQFFEVTFTSVNMTVHPAARSLMAHWAAGFPRIMQLVGDRAYWRAPGNVVDEPVALPAVYDAAEEVGSRYVDQQVYKALKSPDYHSILRKIARRGPAEMMVFQKSAIAAGLTESEGKKFNNFLQKLKKLNVLRSGDIQGEYRFTQRMVALYMWLQASRGEKES